MRIIKIVCPVLILFILLSYTYGYSQFNAQSPPILSTDTIISSYEVYDFIKGTGIEINKSSKKYGQQRIDIKKVYDSIKQIVFLGMNRIKVIDKADSLHRKGYNVYYQNTYRDGGKEYESFLFINETVAFSFTLSCCWKNNMYINIIKTEGNQYKKISNYISSKNISDVINYLEQNNYEIKGSKYVDSNTHFFEQIIEKKDFGSNRAKQKFYLFWFSMAF